MITINLGHDFSIYPVEAALTTDGIQYSTEVETTTADTDVVVLSGSFDPGFSRLTKWASGMKLTLLWVYFEFHIMLKAESSDTADVKFKAQARNKDGTWVDLFAWVTDDDIGTTDVEKIYKGYADIQDNFNEVPFDWRILFQCDTLNEGRARVKNTTYYRAVFQGIDK